MSKNIICDNEHFQRTATIAVETYIRTLEDEGMLNESADYILANYSVVSYEKGFWGSLVERLFGIDKDKDGEKIYFRTVKHIYHKKQKQGGEDGGGRVLKLLDSRDKNDR
jgi:hypothetical protein